MSGKATTEKSKTKKAESLPKGWKRVKVGDILRYKKGKPPVKNITESDIGSFPYLTPEYLRGISPPQYVIKTKNLVEITDDKRIILLWDGSNAGEFFMSKKGFLASTMVVLDLFDNTSYSDFVYYVLKSNEEFLKGQTSGSGIPHVDKNVFNSVVILLPPLPEQQKIVEILETVDNAIEKTDAIIEKYRRIKKGLMADLLTGKIRLIPYGHSEAEGEESPLLTSPKAKKFVIGNKTFVAVPNQKWRNTPIGKIPEDWEVVKLEEVAIKDGIVRGPFGGMLKKENFVSEGYKVYEQGNAIYKTINLGNYYIDRKKYKQMLRFAVKQNDFIISCSGTIGKICMIPQNFEEGVINQALLKITINDKKFDHKFFEYYFEWDAFQNKIIDYTQGGAMQNLIGINEFKKVNFPLPPLPEQQLIADVLSQVDEVIEKEIQYKEKLERIKKGLMEDLLTGKVRVNNLIKEDIQNDTKVL